MIVDSPVISCPRTDAHLSQRNAYIKCEVRAQPSVLVLYWVIDHNGTTLVAGQIIREYWTLVIVSHSSLYFLIFSTRSEMTVGQWVMGRGPNGSTILNRSRGSRVTYCH